MMKKKYALSVLLAVILVSAAIVGIYFYTHNCKQELREVDRYAQPYIIEFMEVLAQWDLETISPYMTEYYRDAFASNEQWKKDFKALSALGELRSFDRPRLVKHSPYKKYFICERAVDFFSVSAEYENANAVVRLQFDNNCGELKVTKFIVTSHIISNTPDYLEEFKSSRNKEQSKDVETTKKEKSKTKDKKIYKPSGKIYRY